MRSRRVRFTDEEDKMLISAVKKTETRDWTLISSYIPSKTAKQCRDRYNHHLKDQGSNSGWTEYEDRIILDMFNVVGSKWKQISSRLPGRTNTNVKNRWQVLSRIQRKSLSQKVQSEPQQTNVDQTHVVDTSQFDAKFLDFFDNPDLESFQFVQMF